MSDTATRISAGFTNVVKTVGELPQVLPDIAVLTGIGMAGLSLGDALRSVFGANDYPPDTANMDMKERAVYCAAAATTGVVAYRYLKVTEP